MKFNKFLSLFLFGFVLVQPIFSQTVKTVGTTGADYSNLRTAFNAINSGAITGNIELQIISSITDNNTAKLYGSGQVGEVTTVIDVTSGSGYALGDIVTFSPPQTAGGVTATGRVSRLYGGSPAGRILEIEITNPGSGYTSAPTVSITSATGTGANPTVLIGGNYTAVSIYPTVTGAVLQSSLQAPIIDLIGADNVTIDGRVNRAGVIANLQIQNTNSLLNSFTYRAFNEANFNTIKFCKLNNSRSERVLLTATTNGVGVADFTIENCIISVTSGAPTDYRSGISISGNTSNQRILIKDNEFVNLLSSAMSSISLWNSPNLITIEGNHFYQTESPTLGANPKIMIRSSGTNILIKGNYMGGSARSTGGSPWSYTDTGMNSLWGIVLDSGSNIIIEDNIIGNFNLSMGGSLFGIQTSNSNSNVTIRNNTFGSLASVNPSIVCTNCTIQGMSLSSSTTNVENNTIGGWEAAKYLYVIGRFSGSGNITGNTIGNLKLKSNATTSDLFTAIESRITSTTISNNYIYGMVNEHTFTTTAINVYGGTVFNNIINLDASSTGNTRGISKTNNGTLDLYHNTVIIGGSVSTGDKNSFALFDNRSDSRNYRNNIFVNNATNTGTATGKHYAIALTSSPSTIDYNNYYASGASGVLGLFNNVDKATLTDWKASTTRDCFSTSLSPGFPTPSGVLISNFLPTQSALVAQPIGTLTTDYLNTTRSLSAPAMGALEYTVTPSNDVFSITSFTPSSGGAGTVVTITGVAFTGVTSVRFNGVNASSFTVVNSTTITAVAPSNVSTGKISLVSACGTVLSANDFILQLSNLTTTSSLTAFSTCTGSASTEQSFTVSGTDLAGDVTVTAPTGYEVSLTSGSGFANSVTITASGTLSATIVYVRLSSSATGTPSGNITITSQGAPTQNVAVSGSITTLSATQSQTNVTCNGGSNGTASVVASGGTAPYTYSWSPSGGTAATATGLTSNIYTCTITDANNCSITRTFTITEPLAINIALAPGANTYSWAPVPGLTGVTSSETNTDMYFIDNQTGWLVGNNFIKKTTDGGVTWSTQLTGFSKMLQGVYFRSATHGWAVGANNAFFYTTDGGVNWNSVTIPGFSASMESYYDVYFTSNTVGYMVGLNFFYKSTDGGLTWTKAVNSGAKRRITVTPNNTIFVVGGTLPTVYKSTNSATSWTTTSSIGSGFGSMNDVTFIDDNIGFVCGAGGTIAKTTDAGVNWTVLTSGTTQNLYAIHFIDSNIGWATGDQNTILKTTDGGATWSLEPQQINGVSIRAIVGFSANNALAMDYGTIAKYISTASPGRVVNVSCNGGSNGQIATLVTGGTSPYTYSWSPSGGTSDNASGLSAGSYTVTVTDANNCSSTANYTVSEPALLTATQTQTNVTCNGLSDGSATVVVSGGTAPYTYAWNSNGGNGVTANNLAAGNYTCTITDANGCILIKNFTITQPSLVPSPTAPATQLFCPGATVATLQATPATGETIQWFSAPTGGTALASTTALVAGTYYAQAVNNNGCNSVRTPVVVATNNALQFDGVNDRVNLTSNSLQDGATAFTIEAWIKPDNSNWDGNWHAIFGNQTGANVNTRNPSFYLRNGKLEVDSFEDGTLTRYYSATDQALVSQNVWNHIALVKDGTTYKIYVNGALGATTPAPNAVNITGPYQLGYIDNYFAGLLDEVRFWNVSRSQSDIQATMNVPLSGTESGLVDYYNFNQGIVGGNNTSITTLLDNTATANNGTLVGFALTGNTSNYMSGFFPQITGPNFVVAGNTITLAHPIAGGTWSSATTAVATVNASTGLVTGVSGGTAVITYTYCGQSTTYTVTVNALPTISSISNQILCANGTPAPINFVIADLETPVANLVITVTSSNAALLPVANISFAGSTGSRTMNYTTIAGVFGSSTVTITIDDSNGGVVTETFTVQVDPDKIETTSGIVTLQAGTPIAVDSGLVINETGTINGALVSITGGFVSGDILAYTGTLPSGVTSSYNATAGVLTFTGNMTPSEAQAILRAVTINTTSSVEQDRTVTFTLGAALPFVQNNHFYQFITAPGISWTNAKAAAEQLTFFGMQGYLTTVTSAAENQFILSKIQGQGWMGASDEQVEGVWRWMTGPEAGQQFWQGAAGGSVVNGMYNNWYPGEPNNVGNEDYAHFLVDGTWNDYPLSLGDIQGYVVEFGGLANDPCVVLSASKVVEVIVNRPPTISSITSPGVVCPNTATNAISFTIDDENTPLNNLVLTAVSSNTTVVPTANIVFSGTGNNRTVVVTPAANQSGTATITITVRDSYNTTASSSFTVTFEDTTLPTVITRNITAFLDANGQTSITAAQVNNGSTDNCGIASVVVSRTNFNCSNVGPNTVTLTVTDVNGNVATATAIVTVAYDFTTTGDNDLDGLPDNCDADDDNDGILDVNDNCPLVANANQLDTDGDGIGNTCDDDDDNDGVLDGFDNCPLTYNPDQNDRDNDGLGDVCDLIEINVAEAITPNGDGVNDTWVIYNIENHPNHAIRVFNRWGDEVFSARNYQNNWDGHYVNKSNALPSGSSYYYQIDLDGDGTVDHDGWIYITK